MKISILLIIKIQIICLITPIFCQRYADSCVKSLNEEEAEDIQSFVNETIYYDLYLYSKSVLNSFMTIGSGIIEDRNDYIQHPYPNTSSVLFEMISEEEPAQNGIVGKVFRKYQRFEWICPANFYSSIFNITLNMFETSITGYSRIRDSSHPLNHNYFVNLRLNSNLEVYAGYGGIVIHSVDLNGFTLTISLPSWFRVRHLKSESIPIIQITNNYGPGTIRIEQYNRFEDENSRRKIIHGGNDASIIIFLRSGGRDRNLRHPNFPEPPKYQPQRTKAAKESEKKSKKKNRENWTYSDVFVICGLICFILSLFFLASPFFVTKQNNFHLLEYYEYYQESDELL